MRVFLLCFLALAFSASPHHVDLFLKQAGWTADQFADKFFQSELAQVVKAFDEEIESGSRNSVQLPLVFMHGMGDSCFNRGMKQITELSGKHLGVYSVCIPTGDTRVKDTNNGFFMTMDDNVDEWARRVALDDNLKNGFHAVGFSQGNSVIRGYIHKYNSPPVHTWLSVHGTIMGVAGFPNCDPQGLLGPVCKLLAEFLGALAFKPFVQEMLFQANYFRDPRRYDDAEYIENSQIAQWNQENPKTANFTFKTNFMQTKRIAMIKALQDSMVFPNEAEWWGQFAPNSLKVVQKMDETPLYQSDAFGLQTLDNNGKLRFNTTEGDHLQFSQEQLYEWLDLYVVD